MSTNPGDTPETIFQRAAARAQQMGLPYAGAVTPAEAQRLREAGAGTLIDVRTPPEYQQVGHVPGTPLIEWPRNGDGHALSAFIEKVRESYDADTPLLLLCRSGARSHYAAHLLTQAGFERAYNVLEGFEGGAPGQGWASAGLPVEKG
jgi:rhodanese-related sulfurtransferase